MLTVWSGMEGIRYALRDGRANLLDAIGLSARPYSYAI